MPLARARRRPHQDYWPGFVDVLSTLLLVVTFLMSMFMVAQYFASQEIQRQGFGARQAEQTDRLADRPPGARALEEKAGGR